MSTITSLGASDTGSVSRPVINTNFTNLDTDKIEAGSTDTLTNKTIDADNNTVSNIGNEEIKAGVDAVKLADGTVTNTELQYINSLSSNAQTQLDDKTSKATLTTKGDIYAASAASTPARLGVGTNDQVLTADSGEATGMKWADATGGLTDPMTTRGDIIVRKVGGTDRLAVGANGQYLKSDGTDIAWSTIAGGGDVSKVGTPVNNQIGVWTGDGNLEGDTALTFDTSTDTLATGILTTTGAVTATGAVTGSNLSGTNTGDEVAASVTVAGVAELATTAEIDTGTDSTRTMPVDQFVASKRNVRWLVFNLVEVGTDCAEATNIAGDFVSPIAGTILQSDSTPFYLYATNSTAGTTGTMVVDISINGTSIMTTNKLSFDSTEKTTTTSATPPDLTTTSLAVGDIITIDIDSIHTTASKGLTVYIGVRE